MIDLTIILLALAAALFLYVKLMPSDKVDAALRWIESKR